MPYSLTAGQIASLSTDYCNAVGTIAEYESAAFQANVEAQIAAANELDSGFKSVWKSHFDDISPLETEHNQITGINVADPISLNSNNEGEVTRPDQTKSPVVDITLEPLVNVGKVTPTVDRITSVANRNGALVSSEQLVRRNVNRFWPARVDNNNIFKAETFDAINSANGIGSDDSLTSVTDQLGNTLLTYNPLLTRSLGQFMTSTSKVVDISDNERFFQFMTDNLIPNPTSIGTVGSVPDMPTGRNVVRVSITGGNGTTVQIGGTLDIITSTSATAPAIAPDPGSPTNNSIIELSGSQVILIAVSPGAVTGTDISKSRTSACTYVKMSILAVADDPAIGNGNATNGSLGQDLINSINANLKRFTFANNTALDTRVGVIRTALGAIDTSGTLYDNRYLAANTRSNLNDGTLGLVEAKNSLKANLFPPTDGGSDPNEYTRLVEKKNYIETVFAGNTPPIDNPTCTL